MNWFRRSFSTSYNPKLAANWKDYRKGFYGPAFLGLLNVFLNMGYSPAEAQQLAEKQYTAQNSSNVTTQPSIAQPTSQPIISPIVTEYSTTQPTTQPVNPTTQQSQGFNYDDFYDHLSQDNIEGYRTKVYDDGVGVKTIGVGHAMGKNPNDNWATRSREVFKKLFPEDPDLWEKVWNGQELTPEQIGKLTFEDIEQHLTTAKRVMPNFDTYPYYLQKALLDGIYRGDIGPKTKNLINQGKWQEAADEYINREDYRNAEENNMRGIKTRMNSNRDAMLQYYKN